ncbi:MAG: hypothetical protein ACO3CQ_00130 [Candidatus Nanopelagicaceae bacterium]
MDDRYIPVHGKNNLVRDSHTSGIVNTDIQSYNSYIEAYKQKAKELKRVESLENELSEIKDDINEIKNLLKSFLSK